MLIAGNILVFTYAIILLFCMLPPVRKAVEIATRPFRRALDDAIAVLDDDGDGDVSVFEMLTASKEKRKQAMSSIMAGAKATLNNFEELAEHEMHVLEDRVEHTHKADNDDWERDHGAEERGEDIEGLNYGTQKEKRTKRKKKKKKKKKSSRKAAEREQDKAKPSPDGDGIDEPPIRDTPSPPKTSLENNGMEEEGRGEWL
jgi:hypothetical protein